MKNNETMLNFYRIVLNQCLFDSKRLMNDMKFINNDTELPEQFEKELKTIKTLVDTYLSVCTQVKSLEEQVHNDKK